ncbi:MAG: hypothetical protein M1824_003396 [Vezdaea acicularis]|nr:MAG: hypothetical protein M1824_003396 [Vezdaea acicularis]
MSAPLEDSDPTAGRRQSLTKLLSRAKTVLSRDKSKRQSISGTSALATPSAPSTTTPTHTTAITTSAPPNPPANPSATPAIPPTSLPTNSSTNPASKGTSSNIRARQQTTLISAEQRSAIQQEKARALFAKYGLTLEPHEWSFPTREPVERVEKPIRMRVHRHCHQCATAFARSKVCPNPQCGHTRCQACPRYPAKKSKSSGAGDGGPGKSRSTGAAAPGLPLRTPATGIRYGEDSRTRQLKGQLRIPSRTGAQDLVYKPARQRVHRTCHRCQTEFGREKVCPNCTHVRCSDCPRDPAHKKKYPNGYSGDVPAVVEPAPPRQLQERVLRKPVRRVKWVCHACEKYFVDGEKTCGACGHGRCGDCKRYPPKKKPKEKPDLDPEIVRSVQEKLEKLSLAKEKPPS